MSIDNKTLWIIYWWTWCAPICFRKKSLYF